MPFWRRFNILALAGALVACEEGAPPAQAPPQPFEPPVHLLPDASPEDPVQRDAFVPEVPEPEPERCAPGDFDPGPALVRRMTRDEYDHTIRDLLGDTTRPARAFAREEEELGFDNNAASLQISPLHVEQFLDAAEAISRRAAERLDDLLPCHRAEPGCETQFIRDFGQRAWRRPLTPEEQTRLLGVFRSAADLEGADAFTEGFRLVTEALLQSPHFLYRIEVGEPVAGRPGVRRLDDWELASRLSYLIWQSMPDDALFAAAAAGELATAEGVATQARRLLADPRAREGLLAFFDQWLRLDEVDTLDRDLQYYPAWRPELRPLFREESRRLLEHLIFSGEGTLADLLSAPYTFVNEDLARYYGLPGVTGPEWRKVDLDPAARNGILTHASLLSVTAKPTMTSPVFRGLYVREQLLCTPLPPPPADIVIVPPDPAPGLSTREKFAEHSRNPVCAQCHHLVDPIGFGFERFDAMGRWRTRDGEHPVDDRGELLGTLDADGAFTGVAELGRRLAESAQVQRCVTRQFFRYAFGRGEVNADRCTLEELFHQYLAQGQDFRALVEHVARSDAFRYRRHVEEDAP